MLTLYRRLIALRRARPALSAGSYEPVDAVGDVLAYARGAGANQCLVALNLGSAPQNLRVPAAFRDARVLLSTALDGEGEVIGDSLALRGDEGVVAAVS
jgi:alpha-glucosidase